MCAAAFSFNHVIASKNSSEAVSVVPLSFAVLMDEMPGQAELAGSAVCLHLDLQCIRTQEARSFSSMCP